jgi:hypothetical protein
VKTKAFIAIITWLFTLLTLLFAMLFLAVPSSSTIAAPSEQNPTPPAAPESPYGNAPLQLSIADKVCLDCHGKPGLSMTLENGEEWDLSLTPDEHVNSIHGKLGYACVQCHTQVGNYPHPSFSAEDARDASLKLYTACERCHYYEYELNQDSVHARALQAGIREAAICTDCHTAHNVRQLYDSKTGKILPDARLWIPQTCAQCHNAIYQKYLTSVHGSALTQENNPDVPTCIDCHGVHNIPDPTTAEFRLKSPQICAKCHTDPALMDKYGISTDVLNTYVADFHGTTLVLFEQKTPDQQFNTPVCYDCHGIHDISRVDDPQKGLEIRENLLARCKECHPQATSNFPSAWLSHYIPSPDEYPAVYYVNLFYKFFIPSVLGGMAVLVVLDIGRRTRDRFYKQRSIVGETRATPTIQPDNPINQMGPQAEENPSEAETSPEEPDEKESKNVSSKEDQNIDTHPLDSDNNEV